MASLVLNKALINGEWVGASTNQEFPVYFPTNGTVVGNAPDMNAKDAEAAVQAAYAAFRSGIWSGLSAKERAGYLRKWFVLIDQHKQEIGQLMTLETGKPVEESVFELNYGNTFVEWFAEETRRINGEILPVIAPSKQFFVTKEPIGVVALVTPWNFPSATVLRKTSAALGAGCTLVIKPAEDTPLTTLALAKLACDAGIPKGVFNVITCSRANAAAVGDVLCRSPLVAGVSFTGSTEVGKLLYEKCANSVKRVGLELGGNAPFIVFNSANIDKAVVGAMGTKFRNCGQACTAGNRFIIQDGHYDEFVAKITPKVKALVVGDGRVAGVNIGPLINTAQFNKVSGLVEDARSKGAKVHTGGRALPEKGKIFYEPTVISNITPDMRLYHEEVFGPVVTVFKFKTEEEGLQIANDTRRGLAGYFYSEDINQIFRVARKLEVGMCGINEVMMATVEAPFGGVKESGFGREGSQHGFDEYLNIKYCCLGNLS